MSTSLSTSRILNSFCREFLESSRAVKLIRISCNNPEHYPNNELNNAYKEHLVNNIKLTLSRI